MGSCLPQLLDTKHLSSFSFPRLKERKKRGRGSAVHKSITYQLLKMYSRAFTTNTLWFIECTNIKQDAILSHWRIMSFLKPQLLEEKSIKPRHFMKSLKAFPKQLQALLASLMVEAVQWKRMEELNFSWSNDPSSWLLSLHPNCPSKGC